MSVIAQKNGKNANVLPGSPTSPAWEYGKIEINVDFRVDTSVITDGPEVVLTASDLPALFTPYINGATVILECRCRGNVGCERLMPGSKSWRVTMKFSTPELKENGGGREPGSGGGAGKEVPGQDTDPTLELPTVKFTPASREVLCTQIFDNVTNTLKPVTNSFGDVFDPPPKVTEGYATLEITRNEPISAPHPAIGLIYQDAVNSDPFWGCPAGVWKVKHILPELQFRQIPGIGTISYLRVSYAFEAKPLKVVNLANLNMPPSNQIVSSWDLQYMDEGEKFLAPPASSATTVGLTTEFISIKGHPTRGRLNGVDGRCLPDRCGFTFVGSIITVPPNSLPWENGTAVQVTNIGGALPSPLVAGTTYFIVGNNPPWTAAFGLSATVGGGAISLSGGSGRQTLFAPGVFFQLRPNARLAFGLLNLPQSFAQCQ